jgi:hypothetical protein
MPQFNHPKKKPRKEDAESQGADIHIAEACEAFMWRQTRLAQHLPQSSPSSQSLNRRVVTIELFGGLSPLANALTFRMTEPAMEFYVDNDPIAQSITRHNLPHTSIWDSIDELTPKIAARAIQDMMGDTYEDSEGLGYIDVTGNQPYLTVVVTHGAPCRDGSSGASATFVRGVEWIRDFQKEAATHPHWITNFIIEQTIPRATQDCDRLREIVIENLGECHASLQIHAIDPKDGSSEYTDPLNYSQPRVFWNNLSVLPLLEKVGAWRCGQCNFGSYKITKIGVPYDDLIDRRLTVEPEFIQDGRWKLHHQVAKEKASINCLFVPMREKIGRDMPKQRSQTCANTHSTSSTDGEKTEKGTTLGCTSRRT